MRRAARVDENQPQIVSGLRTAGCTVTSLAAVGNGCPDLLVGFRGTNHLLEVKNPEKDPNKQKLTPDQMIWHLGWNGDVHIVYTIEDALDAVGARNAFQENTRQGTMDLPFRKEVDPQSHGKLQGKERKKGTL